MRIAIGSDHAGVHLKEAIKTLLTERGHAHHDFGCFDATPVDYPDIGRQVAEAVAGGDFDQGILICSSGIGMCIVANKVAGIRAALCQDSFCARRSREHNDANVLCLGESVLGLGVAREVVETYLSAQFQGGRHARRLKKIKALEESRGLPRKPSP